MNRTANIVIATVMWCAILGYIVWAVGYGHERRALVTVKELRIAAADSVSTGVVSPAMVSRWLAEGGFDPAGQSIDGGIAHDIESHIASYPEVSNVSVWTDLEGVMTVRVGGRTPMMRIRSAGGYRFWFTRDGYILPDRGDFAAYVPVVTGVIPFPFGVSAAGSYQGMQRANYDDFLGRYLAIDAERRLLTGRADSVRAAARTVRASGPRRFWNEGRIDNFNKDRAARLAGLSEELSHLERGIASLEVNKHALAEKEKKSYQSYRFLSKLANFVGFIESDDFWSAQIVQINVLGEGGDENVWREPQLELIPRAGDHVVLLGGLDGTEGDRLEKLRLFYLDALWHEGWEKYGYIDIKYKDQIVCTK